MAQAFRVYEEIKNMRLYLFIVSFVGLLLGSPLLASATENPDELLDSENQSELRQFGWYQWVCYAWAPGYYQPFSGSSYYFQGWFGESQEARRLAHRNALEYCEFYTNRECRSRIDRDCQLHRN
jgi:hypothetical protein